MCVLITSLHGPLGMIPSLPSSFKPFYTNSRFGTRVQHTELNFKIYPSSGGQNNLVFDTLVSECFPSLVPKAHWSISQFIASELSQKVLLIHASLTILVPYIHSRMRDRGLSESWPDAPRSDVRRRMWDNLVRLETLHSTFALIGFITFLWDGR